MFTKVSDDLNEVLHKISGLTTEDIGLKLDKKVLKELKDIGVNRDVCIWVSGCYYCPINGHWELVKCK